MRAEQLHRYSAKRNVKPVNFYLQAPEAKQVFIIGDFNEWRLGQTPLKKGPDGTWTVQLELHHGHHRYLFVVDGQPVLDPNAHGIGWSDEGKRVSIVAVS